MLEIILSFIKRLFSKQQKETSGDVKVVEPPETSVGIEWIEPAPQPEPEPWKRPNASDNLTEHFTYAEMIRSNTASRRGIQNRPDRVQIERFVALLKNVMEPIRNHFGRPVIITSGFRCLELNRAIGSHDNSQHVRGEAIDFEVSDVSLSDVYEWIITQSGLDYDQIIYEFGEAGWIHVSYTKEDRNRKQNLTAHKENGKTVYTSWSDLEVADKAYLEPFLS